MSLAPLHLALIGGGKMGLAMLDGWLAAGLNAENTVVFEPSPSNALKATKVRLNDKAALAVADVVVLAVKPQIMGAVLTDYNIPKNALVLSVAAGCKIDMFENAFGASQRIMRAMPNTPAAIGKGMTAIIGNAASLDEDYELSKTLLSAVGAVVVLDDEGQMDAVTGLSGSGPAYVFYMIEAMAKAGVALGLPEATALTLAKTTVMGAGALAYDSEEPVEVLRQNVTSPNGTTAAGLSVLMNETDGLQDLMMRTINRATERSVELGKA